MENQHRKISGYRELQAAEPFRWAETGKTHIQRIQTGAKVLIRAVAQRWGGI